VVLRQAAVMTQPGCGQQAHQCQRFHPSSHTRRILCEWTCRGHSAG
jgi:hypothetical protein